MLDTIPDAFQSLLTESSTPQIDREHLELMGKRAAKAYIDEGVPLNDTIVKLANEFPTISNEHLKRACEFANQATFKAMFEKQAGADHRCVEFPPADHSQVVKSLSNESVVTIKTASSSDYLKDPHSESEPFDKLAEMFGQEVVERAEMEKEASAFRFSMMAAKMGLPVLAAVTAATSLALQHQHNKQRTQDPDQMESLLNCAGEDMDQAAQALEKAGSYYPEANPNREVFETYERLRDLHDHTAAQASHLGVLQEQATVDLFQKIAAAAHDYGMDEVTAVLYHGLGRSREKLAQVIDAFAPHLQERGIGAPSMEKTAEALKRIPDTGTPLYQSALFFDKVAEEKHLADEMTRRLAGERDRLESHVKGIVQG